MAKTDTHKAEKFTTSITGRWY